MNYTHYDYLELAPGATSKRIEAAYAALLERFQYGMTDAGQDLSGLVRMIHAAYAVLSDPETRKAYDAQLLQEATAAELQSQLDGCATRFIRVQRVSGRDAFRFWNSRPDLPGCGRRSFLTTNSDAVSGLFSSKICAGAEKPVPQVRAGLASRCGA